MKLEKHFYDEKRAMWKEIMAEVAQENARMTESERLEEQGKRSEEISRIEDIAEKERARNYHLVNAKQYAAFQSLSKMAVWLAREVEANITVETINCFSGKITLEADNILLMEMSNPLSREILCQLIASAGDTWFSTKECDGERLVQIELVYSWEDRVPK